LSRGANQQRTVVGLHSCEEAIRVRPQWVTEVVFMEGKDRELQGLQQLCQKTRIKTKTKGKKYFNALAEGHQGVAVQMNSRPRWQGQAAQKPESLVVFLDGITDPHNMGAILRTSWLLAVDGIFIPKNRRVDLTPVVCKVASGGAEHVPVESCHFGSQLQWFKDQGYWVYGLREQGDLVLPQLKPGGKTVLIVGAEGKGLRVSTESFCDQFISIPQVAGGSSYNASVAFALCAYEASRHRHI
jgi:23S rRNA (guanosine2251-2'-O)-methyltransferase